MRISEPEVKEYATQGYVIPECKLPREIFAVLGTAVQSLVDANPHIRSENLVLPFSKRPTANPYNVVQFEELVLLANLPMFSAVASQILNVGAKLWGAQVFCKPAKDGLAVPWHQDGYYWPIRPLLACSIWIAIDPSTRFNGGLRAIAGSHRQRAIFPHVDLADPKLSFGRGIEEGYISESDASDVELRPSQISIHDPFLVHGSRANSGTARRAGFVIRFMSSESRFVG